MSYDKVSLPESLGPTARFFNSHPLVLRNQWTIIMTLTCISSISVKCLSIVYRKFGKFKKFKSKSCFRIKYETFDYSRPEPSDFLLFVRSDTLGGCLHFPIICWLWDEMETRLTQYHSAKKKKNSASGPTKCVGGRAQTNQSSSMPPLSADEYGEFCPLI